MSYTALALVAVAATVVLDWVVLRTRLLRRRVFWTAYAIVVFFQLVVNGILTCRDVVTYNPAVITGFRIACAPVEDLLFGFALVTQTLSWWVWWGCRLRPGSANTGGARSGPGEAPAARPEPW